MSETWFMEMDGAEYKPESNEAFDLATCIGASWVLTVVEELYDF
jgi:hypothetical protein